MVEKVVHTLPNSRSYVLNIFGKFRYLRWGDPTPAHGKFHQINCFWTLPLAMLIQFSLTNFNQYICVSRQIHTRQIQDQKWMDKWADINHPPFLKYTISRTLFELLVRKVTLFKFLLVAKNTQQNINKFIKQVLQWIYEHYANCFIL